MKKTLLLLATTWLLIYSINAQDYLNVITINNPVQSYQLDNVDKITFDEENIYIDKTDNSTESFLFNDAVMLTFLNPIVTQIKQSLKDDASGIEIFHSRERDAVAVKSNSEIKHVEICTMLGIIIKELKPNALQAEISMRNVPHGVYVVPAFTAEKKRISQKIIKL
jgi:hypothetical protein